jgi:hypothetical protein
MRGIEGQGALLIPLKSRSNRSGKIMDEGVGAFTNGSANPPRGDSDRDRNRPCEGQRVRALQEKLNAPSLAANRMLGYPIRERGHGYGGKGTKNRESQKYFDK